MKLLNWLFNRESGEVIKARIRKSIEEDYKRRLWRTVVEYNQAYY